MGELTTRAIRRHRCPNPALLGLSLICILTGVGLAQPNDCSVTWHGWRSVGDVDYSFDYNSGFGQSAMVTRPDIPSRCLQYSLRNTVGGKKLRVQWLGEGGA